MKKMILLALIVFQTASAFAQTKSDTAAIKETAANYVEGFYTNDYKRVEKAVHVELAKRLIVKDSIGGMMVRNMGFTELAFNARKFKKQEDATGIPFKVDVFIYDISHDIATVKVVQNKMKFFDYVQMAKINGEWKIINVLWARME
jgi:hypothetical protein